MQNKPHGATHGQFFGSNPGSPRVDSTRDHALSQSMTSDGEAKFVDEAGLRKRVLNGLVSWRECTGLFGIFLLGFFKIKRPLGVGCSGRGAWLVRLNETRTLDLDSALDLWLLGHFKLRTFRLSHRASRTGMYSLALSPRRI